MTTGGADRFLLAGSVRPMLRRLTALLAALALSLSACGGGDDPEEGNVDDRPRPKKSAPNIVFVLLDDATKAQYTQETMPFTWRYMRRNGTTFEDFLVTSPLCCPARASIITGQYGHNTGVLANSYGAIDDPENVLPVWLQRAGYRTAHVGKFLNNYENALDDPAEPTPGWDDWFTQLEPQRYFDYEISDNGRIASFGRADEDYLTRVLNTKATQLIDEYAEGGETFYLELDQFAPHFAGGQAGRCRGSAEPDPADVGSFRGAEVPRSASLFEPDRSDKPSFIRRLPEASAKDFRAADTRYACALESLRAVDRGFQEIVATLKERQLLEETVLVLSSDNGLYFGEHGIPGEKHFPYREAYEVPLQISMPNAGAEAAPARVTAPVASIDLAPTFLELAGAEPCSTDEECRPQDGLSLVPLMDGRGDAVNWSGRPRGIELSLSENNEPYDRVCEYFGVRDGPWAYVQHETVARVGEECRPSGESELYDLERDPLQLNNLTNAQPGVSSRLDRLARSVRDCEGASCRRLGPAP